MPIKHKICVDEYDGPTPKRGRQVYSVIECTNYVVQGGVCLRHDATSGKKTHAAMKDAQTKSRKKESARCMGQSKLVKFAPMKDAPTKR